jgi:hypothetical protein
MSLAYVRERYGVPARRGARVRYRGLPGEAARLGRVTSARGPHIRVRLDGERRSRIFHPTWRMEYLMDEDVGLDARVRVMVTACIVHDKVELMTPARVARRQAEDYWRAHRTGQLVEPGRSRMTELEHCARVMLAGLDALAAERAAGCDHVTGRSTAGAAVFASGAGGGEGLIWLDQYDFCPRCGLALRKEMEVTRS